MESLEQVNIARKSIIDTLKTEKSIMDEIWKKKQEEIEKEVSIPAYYGLELAELLKTFLEWDKSARLLDQRVIKEMEEWITAVKKVVIGIESQEDKLKQQQQINDTLRTQINLLKSKIEKQGTVTPEFKESIKVIDEEIKEIEADRLTDEELEKGKHLFKELNERLCLYLYNKKGCPTEIDKKLDLSSNTASAILRRFPNLFEVVGKTREGKAGRRGKAYSTTKEGKELIERIIKKGKILID